MINASSHAVTCLREELLGRQTRNPAYSAMAFARDLGVSRAYLSLLLSGKRPLSYKQSVRFAAVLGLDRASTRRLVKAAETELLKNKGGKALPSAHLSLDLERFKAIADWHHTALLDLTTTRGFKSETAWIARRLGISKLEAQDAIERLLRLGLLEKRRGKIVKTQAHLYVSTQKSESAVRTHHTQMIGKALEELKDPAGFGRRTISGMTMSLRADRLDEARRRIEEFTRELAEFAAEGDDCDRIYQLNVQFFPLTKEDT